MFLARLLLFFILIDATVVASHFFLGERIHFFDLDREGNLASLVAGVKLWGIGTIVLLVAIIFFRLKKSRLLIGVWVVASLGFFWIGLDDMMGIHERIGFVLNNVFERGGFYGESFNWLLYYSPFIAAGIIVIGMLFLYIWKESRLPAIFAGIGLIVWIFSLGFELIGRWILTSSEPAVFLYHSTLVAEEAFEMVGADFFLIGIVLYFIYTAREHIVLR